MFVLCGLGESLWADLDVRKRLDHGIGGLIRTVEGAQVAPMDTDHCWLNREVLGHVMAMMHDQRRCQLPSKTQLEDQLKILYARMTSRDDVTDDVDSIDAFILDDKTAAIIYCLGSSIKRLLRHLKRAFTRQHCPRDWANGRLPSFAIVGGSSNLKS